MRNFILLIFIALMSSKLYSQSFTEKIVLDNYYGREAQWGDFDKDGDLDILAFYTQSDAYGTPYLRILENVDTGFVQFDVGLPVVESFGISRNGAAGWVDYNNDGFLDVYVVIGKSFSAVTKLFRNNGDRTFTESNPLVTDILPGSTGPSWGDYDNDGDPDMLIFGTRDYMNNYIELIENHQETNTFTKTNLGFGSCILKGRMPWADYNNDGYLDFLAFKPINDFYETCIVIFKNNGNKTFTEIAFPSLAGLNMDILNQTGDISWGDYNSDGNIDILISGQNTPASNVGITALYKNNGDGTFTDISIPEVYGMTWDTSIEWGDIDSDGDLDILQTGDLADNIWDRTRIFNNNNGSFVNSGIENFLGVHQHGMSTAGDFNNDGKLDVLVLGDLAFTQSRISLYKNTTSNINLAPGIPANLKAKASNQEIEFSWSRPLDDLTNSLSISYNIYILKDNDTIVATNALSVGKRILTGMGNTQQNPFYKLKCTSSGNYKWGVQAIDNSWLASPFTAEQSFNYSSAGITNSESEEIQIYPNPVVGDIIITSSTVNEKISIVLYNMTGKELVINDNLDLPAKINLQSLHDGIYILKLKIGNTFRCYKLSKI